MRLLMAPLILLATTAAATPLVRFTLVSQDSTADARVPFMGIANASARFPQMSGEIAFWPDRQEAFDFHIEIDARAIESSSGMMTRTLKGQKFFDVANHPTITFAGTDFRMTSTTEAQVSGELTARGVTRPVALAVTFATPPMQTDGTMPIDFTASTTIDRREFGMKAYPLIVGNIVKIAINARMEPE